MTLLSEASFLVTPNGYKASKLYAAIPTNGDGDMTFTRATAATRVDENGLVNYALGVEEVTNGDFSNGSTDWTPFSSTFVVSNANPYNGNDTALFTALGVNGAKVTQSITTVIGNTYHLSCYAQYNSGDNTFIEIEGVLEYPNGLEVSNSLNTWTYLETSFTATSTTSVVAIRERGGNNNASCYLYGLSVKEVNNIPRIDYTGGGCPSILLEPQRTNLFLRSEEFDNAYWTRTGAELTANAINSPTGVQSADFLVPGLAVSEQRLRRDVSGISSNTAYTLSVFAKAGGYNYIAINHGNYLIADHITYFDLQNGVVATNAAGSTPQITDLGNGWYRCSVTRTTTASQTTISARYLAVQSDNVPSFAGDGTSGIYLWGAQLEAGAYPTSYIPTTTATVTRNADVISKTGISDLIGSTEGTIFCQLQALANYSDFSRISISGANANDKISIGYNFGNGIQAVVSVAGSLIVNFNVGGNPITNNNKIAFKYKLNSFTLFVNGVSLATLSSGAIFSASTLKNIYFTDGDGSSFPIYGKLSSLALWKTALTDQECINLTTL
jgi:hypothetical protein